MDTFGYTVVCYLEIAYYFGLPRQPMANFSASCANDFSDCLLHYVYSAGLFAAPGLPERIKLIPPQLQTDRNPKQLLLLWRPL